jgi:hypothetical protein
MVASSRHVQVCLTPSLLQAQILNKAFIFNALAANDASATNGAIAGTTPKMLNSSGC